METRNTANMYNNFRGWRDCTDRIRDVLGGSVTDKGGGGGGGEGGRGEGGGCGGGGGGGGGGDRETEEEMGC